jgi:acetyl esterase
MLHYPLTMASAFTERALRATLRGGVRIPAGWLSQSPGVLSVSDVGATLDRQTLGLLAWRRRLRVPDLADLDLPWARRAMADLAKPFDLPPMPLARVEDQQIPARGGELRVRIYHPRRSGPALPVMMYLHGGGFTLGDLESHDRLCRLFAHQVRCLVVAVDYRRGPEYLFPAALHDAWDAFQWLVHHAGDLGGDPGGGLVLAGDSAGGNLATLVALRARDEQAFLPTHQLLICPVTDLSCSQPSHRTFGQGFLLSAKLVERFMAAYVPPDMDRASPELSPLFIDDLAGLPPATVVTAGFDALRDEGRLYAERLRQAGVKVEHLEYPGMIHGFTNLAGVVDGAHAALVDMSAALRRALSSS